MAGEPEDARRLLEEERLERIRSQLSGVKTPAWKKILHVLYFVSPIIFILIAIVVCFIESGVFSALIMFFGFLIVFVLFPSFFCFLSRARSHPSRFQRRISFLLCTISFILGVVIIFISSSYLSSPTTSSSSNSSSSSFISPASDRSYVASVNSDKFHVPSCRYADNISDENRVYYDSRGDALSDGKSPCSSCNP